MKKKFLTYLFLLVSGAMLFAAGNSEKSSKTSEDKTLNVIATSAYKDLFDVFSAKTGAKVEFLSMSSGEALARVKAEGKSMADVWFGGGLDAFIKAKTDGLLENYISPNAKDIPAQYKDPDGAWIAKGITVVGFIGNKSVLAEKKLPMPKTWDELADPKYKGEVIMSTPAVSGTMYAAVKGILDLKGEKDGWTYWEKLNKNIPVLGKRGKDPQEKTALGEYAVGIIPADGKAFKLAEDKNLEVVYPADGIPWVPEGAAIFKGAKNLKLAQSFIDFMLSKEGQEIIARLDGKDTAQIIKPGVKGLSLGLPKEKLIKEDISTFGSERQANLDKFEAIRNKLK